MNRRTAPQNLEKEYQMFQQIKSKLTPFLKFGSAIAGVLVAFALIMGAYILDFIPWLIYLISLVAIVIADLWLLRTLGDQNDDDRRVKVRSGQKTGHYISTIESNFILRPILSLQAGYLVTFLVYALADFLGTSIFPLWAAIILMVLLTILFALNDVVPAEVDNTHVGIMTFFKRRFRWYLEEGTHHWYGGHIGFGISKEPLPNAKYGTKAERDKGQVFIGNRPLDIWGSRGTDSGGNHPLTHVVVASDKSTINTSLTLTIRTEDPLTWANSQDPILDASERSRAAFRSHIDLFTGPDNVDMKDAATLLMGGTQLMAAFTAKPVDIYPKGSVIRNSSGRPIFETFEPKGEDEDDAAYQARISDLKRSLTDRINNEADREMLDVIAKDSSGNFVQQLGVQRNLVETMDAIGAYFDHASVGRITLSDEVTKAANKASAENQERVGQLKSAETAKKVRDSLKGDGTPESELGLMAALAQDGHATIVFVPGSDRLTRAAVAGATTMKGK